MPDSMVEPDFSATESTTEDPSSETTHTHWLVGVVETLGFDTAAVQAVSALTPAAEAWDTICSEWLLTEEELAERVADYFRSNLADLEAADPHALRLVTESLARRYGVFPVRESGRQLVVATCDPTDLMAEQTLGFASARKILFEIAGPNAIQEHIDNHYSPNTFVEQLLASSEDEGIVEIDALPEADQLDSSDAESEPVIRLANLILRDAIRQGASDIHFQPEAYGGIVRLRVDGVLRPYMQLPAAALVRVVARMKVLGNMDIADRFRPQDGRARTRIDGSRYDLRISTVPARRSEKAVIRVLDQSRTIGGLDDIGLTDPELIALRQALSHRDGIVIVTGPTGSGKTTTLYSAIRELAKEEVNVMTVEDPIEYELAGITQIQVEPKRGVTFASCLRAILRQDPDIVLVGEIRDAETAEMAVQAATTGHLVLSTLHTNDAIGSVRRLLDIGLNRPSIADTLRAVLAQRLVRRTCTSCAEADPERRKLCRDCGGTGYRGRRPLVEVFEPNSPIRRLIVEGGSLRELELAARRNGMRTMATVAEELILDGTTDRAEVERVLGLREEKPTDIGPPLVMVVDDDPADRLLARTFLEQAGFKVIEACDGVEALDLLQTTSGISLAVVDLNMPRMDGLELLTVIRETPATALLPIVVLTGSEEGAQEIRSLESGADDYLRKPIDPQRFLARVRGALRRAQAIA